MDYPSVLYRSYWYYTCLAKRKKRGDSSITENVYEISLGAGVRAEAKAKAKKPKQGKKASKRSEK